MELTTELLLPEQQKLLQAFEAFTPKQRKTLRDTLAEIRDGLMARITLFERHRQGFQSLLEQIPIAEKNGSESPNPHSRMKSSLETAIGDCEYQIACLKRDRPQIQLKIAALDFLILRDSLKRKTKTA